MLCKRVERNTLQTHSNSQNGILPNHSNVVCKRLIQNCATQHTHTHTHIYIYAYMYIYICIYMCIYVYICIYIYIYIYSYISHIYAHIDRFIMILVIVFNIKWFNFSSSHRFFLFMSSLLFKPWCLVTNVLNQNFSFSRRKSSISSRKKVKPRKQKT